jgi:ATP-dependent helicase HrpB
MGEFVSGLSQLPIDEHISAIVAAVRAHRALVVTAAPGAGKTTRVPPALLEDGPLILLEPRRVAARAIARRIADERGWTVGGEIGWHVRFERQFSERTRLLVATEGVLTARLQQDPLASAFRTIVLDEFHERSVHGDIGLALARQAWLARPDLRLVVMSATMDAGRVAAFLDGCPIVSVEGRTFPIEVGYRPVVETDQAIVDTVSRTPGSILCFLPGAPEIQRAAERLAARRAGFALPVLLLHGSLPAEQQDAAIRPANGRRVILATNIAETTLTVPDVTAVVDTGVHKVARYDPARAIDSLEIERISLDSADQRAGRAGRTAPGVVVRLWDSRDRLRPHREPEIARVDLASTLLDVIGWGANPRTFEWFDSPPRESIEASLSLLGRLEAIDGSGRLTDLGRALQAMPLPPRLGRMLVAARGAASMARACALLSERSASLPKHQATTCDLLAAVDRASDLPPHVLTVARDLQRHAKRVVGAAAVDVIDDESFRRAVLAGYPDRVARRRAPRTDGLTLASGTGARLARDSGVVDAEFLVAVEMRGSTSGPAGEPIVRIATGIEREWLEPTGFELVHTIDGGVVRARRVDMYGALAIKERAEAVDPDEAARLVADECIRRGPGDEDAALLRRLEFAGAAIDFADLVRGAAHGVTRVADVDISGGLSDDLRRRLAKDAPASVRLTNGTDVRLEYRGDGRAIASLKLQKVIGVTETPRIGPRRVPVTFELLAPNNRPVQVTSDLASFWSKSYPEIRGPLRARYPKHQWP